MSPSVLMTFNEILEKGFDGHNFVSGLNSHFRDLLVSRDEITLRLLEATPSIKQRYLRQTKICSLKIFYLKPSKQAAIVTYHIRQARMCDPCDIIPYKIMPSDGA